MKTADRDRVAHDGAGKSGPSALARLSSRIKRYLILPLIFLSLASSPSFSVESNKGWAAYERGDYATALREWRPLAEQGNADAQFNVGHMYEFGKGVPQNYDAAVNWYRLAAEQGVAKAQFNLALVYDLGKGVPQDYNVAVKWYRLAAEQGVAEAQHNLGLMYRIGRGVPQDYKAAEKWLRLAAEQGYALA